MSEEAQLQIYLARLEQLCLERLSQRNISVLEVLKESLSFIEGEMKGY